MPIDVFFSYSHRNSAEKEALCESLKALPQVKLWTDSDILPGDEWEPQIDAALNGARLAILLVTKEFLNSKYVKSRELPRLLERQRSERVRVVPIIARACPWNLHEWLHRLQVLPTGGVPIWRDDSRAVDEVLNQVVQAINGLLARDPDNGNNIGQQPPFKDGDAVARVHSIAGGLDALSELRTASSVNDTVAAFREDFHTASVNIELVTHYKRLHDELHTIHNYYRQLIDNVRWFPEDTSVLRQFGTVHADLETSVLELKRVQSETPPGGSRANWVSSVDQATSRLATGIETGAKPVVSSAIAALRRVLAQEPARLNQGMNNSARDINVHQLVKALRRVRDSLISSTPRSRSFDRFEQGLASLETLELEWKALVEKHKGWEDVEATQRLIDESMSDAGDALDGADDLQELRVQFDYLTEAIAKLVALDSGDWLMRLRKVHADLAAALGQGDDAAARKQYMLFRSLTGRCFKNLDTKLKELCGELSHLGKRLELLAE